MNYGWKDIPGAMYRGKKVKNEMNLHFNMLPIRHLKTKAKSKKWLRFKYEVQFEIFSICFLNQ